MNINIKTKLIELNTYKNLPRIYIKIDKIFIPKTKLTCEYLCESWQHLYKYFVYFRKCMFMLQTEESDKSDQTVFSDFRKSKKKWEQKGSVYRVLKTGS